MDDFGSFQSLVRNIRFAQHHVRVGAAVEAEIPLAKKLGATITYDPNYRANLWKNKEDAIAQMKAPLPLVDILKVSDEELPLLTAPLTAKAARHNWHRTASG